MPYLYYIIVEYMGKGKTEFRPGGLFRLPFESKNCRLSHPACLPLLLPHIISLCTVSLGGLSAGAAYGKKEQRCRAYEEEDGKGGREPGAGSGHGSMDAASGRGEPSGFGGGGFGGEPGRRGFWRDGFGGELGRRGSWRDGFGWGASGGGSHGRCAWEERICGKRRFRGGICGCGGTGRGTWGERFGRCFGK